MPQTITTTSPEVQVLRHAFDYDVGDTLVITDCVVQDINGVPSADPSPAWFDWRPVELTSLGDRARIDLELTIRPYDAHDAGVSSFRVTATVSDSMADTVGSWLVTIGVPTPPTDPDDPDNPDDPTPPPDDGGGTSGTQQVLMLGGIPSAQLGGIETTRIRVYSLPDMVPLQDYTHSFPFLTTGLTTDPRDGTAYFFRTGSGSNSMIGEGILYHYDPKVNDAVQNQTMPEELVRTDLHPTDGGYYGVGKDTFTDSYGRAQRRLYRYDVDAGTHAIIGSTKGWDLGGGFVFIFNGPPLFAVDGLNNRLYQLGEGGSIWTGSGDAPLEHTTTILVSTDLAGGGGRVEKTWHGDDPSGFGHAGLHAMRIDHAAGEIWLSAPDDYVPVIPTPPGWKLDLSGNILLNTDNPNGRNVALSGSESPVYSGGSPYSLNEPRKRVFQINRDGTGATVALKTDYHYEEMAFGRL